MVRRQLLKPLAMSLVLIATLFATTAAECSAPAVAGLQEAPPRHVLLINSYDQLMSWVANLTNAANETLAPEENNLVLHIENMDTKRYHSEEYYTAFRETLRAKYRSTQISLILCSDNNAFDFLRAYRNELFPGVPVVFCGVNDFSPEMLKGLSGFTGVAEVISPGETVKLILRLHPDTKEIFIINDYLKTGRAWEQSIRKELEPLHLPVKFTYNRNLSLAELKAQLMSLPQETVVLLGVYFSDRDGLSLTYETVGEALAGAARVPVYCLLDFNIRGGIIGGKVISGYHQGQLMAQYAMRVLKGERPDSIPPMQSPEANRFIFDYKGLVRHGIPEAHLPEGAVVLNKPFSLYETYRYQTWLVLCLIITLCITIIALLSSMRLREQAERMQQRFRHALDHAGDSIVLFDAETRSIVDVNVTACASLGYTREELLTKKPEDLNTVYNTQELLDDMQRHIAASMEAVVIQTRNIRKDGSTFPVEVSLRTLPSYQGQAPLLIASVRDISERMEAQDRLEGLQRMLQLIIDSMPSILVAVTREGFVLQWNKWTEQQTGRSSDKAQGKHLSDVFPRLAKEMGNIRKVIDSGQPAERLKVKRFDAGRTLWENITIFPLAGQSAQAAVLRVDDVTERVRIEDMMIQTEKMMSVGGLAAGMAHEINNPLGGIIQGLQNVQRRFSPDLPANREVAERLDCSLETMHRYMEERMITRMLEGAWESATRAARIVANMLDFSRRTGTHFEPHEINGLLEDCVELVSSDYDLRKGIDFRKISIVREFDSSLPLVNCCRTEIEQVFLNLMKNAAEAMAMESADRKPEIILRTRSLGDSVLIEICDNGPGMDEETSKRVFEPFFTTKPTNMGTGLGLSVSYFIVTENHHGSIQVLSTKGEGATFRITLPVSHAAQSLQGAGE
ncbi:PAS domain S-box protein [Desulfovibrio mangrovi]|uniref:ABC transporter substrate binding protein n=1 Tax=Desulfovibrio mangrovi TaxID=2976983 RepID=UPI002246B82A|nr:ABC transporter substrate binding protein [Desulfovibrio mangrovi]UZP66692.1 PAS domain S-box protein [Desulfovibrio mangrovi]